MSAPEAHDAQSLCYIAERPVLNRFVARMHIGRGHAPARRTQYAFHHFPGRRENSPLLQIRCNQEGDLMISGKNPVLVCKRSRSQGPGSLESVSNTLGLGPCIRACCALLFAFPLIFLNGCKKEAKVVVPDVSHQELAQAQQTLNGVPLKVGNIAGVTGTPPPGTYVVSTSPVAGQQVAAYAVVDLVVKLPVTVPPVTGLAVTDAVSALQEAGLKVAFVSKPTVNPFAKAKVSEQAPAAQSPVQDNATVTLVVSTPPDIGGLLGFVSQQPAYQKLKPEYKSVLDAFMGNPSTPRGMGDAPAPPSNAPSSVK